jgi:hypothetical protein
MEQSSIPIDALSSACWGKKGETAGGFLPRVGHTLLAVLHEIFAAVRYN